MPIIDLHCDTIDHLIAKPELTLNNNNLSIDISKLKTANSIAQFFALYIDLQAYDDILARCLSMVDVFYRELEANANYINIAHNYAEMLVNKQAGKLSAFLTIEEGAALQGKLENLRNFYRLGVRLITLTWNYPNEIGFPNCQPEYMEKGLTEFGQQAVAEMNRLGIIVDVSHLSDGGFYDVAAIANKPFIASHSNARAICDHSRNLTDDMIKLLAHKGGVMGINFCSSFLKEAAKVSRVEDMVAHIKHIYNVGGIDVISLGSDFDGIRCKLEIDNIGEIDKLIAALKKAGFNEADIDKICFENALRVIKDCM